MANSIQNKDLFWALRGGGGGTFGVVTSVTLRTFPDPPAFFSLVNITSGPDKIEQYWKFVENFHAALPGFSDAGGSGYYSVLPATPTANGSLSQFSAQIFFANVTDAAVVHRVLDPIISEGKALDSSAQVVLEAAPDFSGTISQVLASTNAQGSDGGGGIVIIGSRMISREFLQKPGGAAVLIKALRDIQAIKSTTGYTGHVVAGGTVAANKHIDSALNPAWRRAQTHIVFARDWNSTTSFKEQLAIREKLNKVELPILQRLEPDMGAYQNEADPYEVNFQHSFFGSNYARLYRIKQQVDPKNLFIVRSGVGSENWDDAGLCRV